MTTELADRPRLRARLVPPLLGDLPFRRYWAAQTISFFGDQINWIALPLVAVLTLDAGPGQMGLLGAVGTVPNLLFSLHAGALVDRRGPSRPRSSSRGAAGDRAGGVLARPPDDGTALRLSLIHI